MAATLKLGDRKWATKEGSLLAYNDENNNIKPLPFDFTRASSATRVNKQGLIETVASGVPRIDYTDANGALKLEPQRTNLFTYSEDIEEWSSSNAGLTIEENADTSPEGLVNAAKIKEDGTNGAHSTRNFNGPILTSGTDYTFSFFAKKAERSIVGLSNTIGASNDANCFFDLDNGQILTNTFNSASIEDFGNGWYRCIATDTADANDDYDTRIYTATADNQFSHQGVSGSGLYIFGLQLEQGSYATSYIPTQGSAVTRIADECIQTPPSGIIGQTEGTVYCEVNISNTTSKTILILDTGSASNFIILEANSGLSPRILVRQSSGSFPAIITGTTMSYGINKIAFCYKSGDYAMYVNGVLSGTSASTTFPSGIISKISVGANPNYGYLSDTVADVKLYDTRLSNAEFATLTTI